VDALLRPACEVALQVARVGLAASPPVPVPRQLRAVVRFAKLSDHAVAAVRRLLDEDDDFRARVRDALADDPRRDDLGRASLLFLERPEGWQAELDALAAAAEADASQQRVDRAEAVATRRLAAVEAALARAEADLVPLRETVGALRAELAEARRGRRTAESDAGRLRKRVAELEAAAAAPPAATTPEDVARWSGAVAAAEQRAERAEADAAEQRARADEAVAALAEARQAPSPAPAPDPDVDRAAVGAAVSAAVAAVGTLAEALGRAAEELAGGPVQTWPPVHAPAQPPPDRRPPTGAGRPAREPVPLPPATFDDTAEAVEHLLRVPGALVLVDGYNVTLATRGELALADQRRWLVDAVGRAAARTGAEFQVVFDGADGRPTASHRRHLGVRVRFTQPEVEADDEILALVAGLPSGRPAVVASDDRRVRDGARRLGANVVGVDPLVEALRRAPS
jgi:hypothetical protein